MTRNLLITLVSLSTAITSGTANARGSVALTSTPPNYGPTMTPILGDLNSDCIVTSSDLRQALRAVGSASSIADLNGDSVVNGVDVDMIAAQLGFTCSDRLMGDVNGDGIVSTADIQAALGSVGTNAPVHDVDGNGAVNDRPSADPDQPQRHHRQPHSRRCRRHGEVQRRPAVGLAHLDQQGSADCDGDGLVTETDPIEARWAPTRALPGDLNGDRIVDGADQGSSRPPSGQPGPADADGDGSSAQRT